MNITKCARSFRLAVVIQLMAVLFLQLFLILQVGIAPGAPDEETTTVTARVEVLDLPRVHPYLGAKNESGSFGYVHNPKFLKGSSQFIIPPNESGEICAPPYQGPEGKGSAYDVLHEKVKISNLDNKRSRIRLFCSIYTYPGNHNKTLAIEDTWGKRCDGFLAASTETHADQGIVHIPHFGGHEGGYMGIWQKVRSMWAYIYQNFLNDYDFFHICGDDTYLIVENLKALIASDKFIQDAGGPTYPNPIYMGEWVHPFWREQEDGPDFYYMGGGPGYTLSRAAVKVFVEVVLPACENETVVSAEDLFVGRCFWRWTNITGYDARDETGANRYHGTHPEWLIGYSATEPHRRGDRIFHYFRGNQKWLARQHNFTALGHEDLISNTSISFHYVTSTAKMRRFEKLLYRRDFHAQDCGNTTNNITN